MTVDINRLTFFVTCGMGPVGIWEAIVRFLWVGEW
jgi:hypothetical protein